MAPFGFPMAEEDEDEGPPFAGPADCWEYPSLACAARAWNPRRIQLSYSLPTRRSASRMMTSRMVPMHEAAKAPLLPTCHDSARKHESIVYQFHSIDELHVVLPDMLM